MVENDDDVVNEDEDEDAESKKDCLSEGVENRFDQSFRVPRFDCPFLRDDK